ncbi:hypothetical protein [Microbacterium sp. MYb66]|jgi:uncharacterized Zn finger protein (UPF0148 family)|uniref:hypothetical protein n=1 Tax=Microbacterium sp. MYb66 TaxID=1848692 RepID=UPI0015E2D917|nr:hypothetical protein [Microbacterium sp. MYb66]
MEIRNETPPHCPEDDVVMLAVAGGWQCPECGHLRQAQDVEERWMLEGGDPLGPNH